MKKHSLNIGISSKAFWLYKDGDMEKPPIRARSDANCDIFIGKFTSTHDGAGEESIVEEYIKYSPSHIIKLRDGRDGFLDEKYYGKIETRQGNSPFIK